MSVILNLLVLAAHWDYPFMLHYNYSTVLKFIITNKLLVMAPLTAEP